MSELAHNFPNSVIGLSDHTITNHACFGSVALGASILERHYTDSMSRKGPDIANSMDPIAAKELIEGANIIAQARGGTKGPINEEKSVIEFAFASVVSIRKINKNELLSKDNIWVKRPGTGPFFARDYDNLIGKKVKREIENDQHITMEDLYE